MRRTRALAVLALLAGLLVHAPAPAAAGAGTTRATTLSPAARLGASGPSVRVARVETPHAGTYRVIATMRVTHRNPDPKHFVGLSLGCNAGQLPWDRIGSSANVLRGETLTLSSALYVTLPARGSCSVYAATTRMLGAPSASPATRRVSATVTLSLAGPVSPATRETRRFVGDDPSRGYAGRSALARPGRAFRAGGVDLRLPRGARAAQVSGQAYLTTCTSTGGSRDRSVPANLCTRSVVRKVASGALLRTRLVVQQYRPDAVTPCRTTAVPGSLAMARITAHRHHRTLAVQGMVGLAGPERGCGSRVRAWQEVLVVSGPAVVVHWPNTTTAVRPV